MIVQVTVVLVLTVAYSGPLVAQTAFDVGSIRGTVRDESGALVTGSKGFAHRGIERTGARLSIGL